MMILMRTLIMIILQFIADSLGIAINDSVELRNLFLTYEK